ncbi:MAG: TIR domain-containing protein [Nitrospirota bacterium]
MTNNKHKVFISYHHANDQAYKQALQDLNDRYDLFIDGSVDTGDIDDNLDDDVIRQKIRDEYLKDSTVTILLVGLETKKRKHIDWEIYSSMFNGKVNKQSGVLVINLPSTGCTYYTAAHGDNEKKAIYPENTSWTSIKTRDEYEKRYPYLPARIIDNLLKSGAKVSVTNWDKIASDVEKLRFLINASYDDRAQCDYDLSRRMRRADS